MKIQAKTINKVGYVLKKSILKIAVSFLLIIFLDAWLTENISPSMTGILLLALTFLSFVHSALKLRKDLYIFTLDEKGLLVEHEKNKEIHDFYPHEEYVFSINTYRYRSNMITVQKEITLVIQNRETLVENSFNIINLSFKNVDKFNTMSSRYEWKTNESASVKNAEVKPVEQSEHVEEWDFDSHRVETPLKMLKESIWIPIIGFVLTIAAFSYWLSGEASIIWAIILLFASVRSFINIQFKFPRESLTYIELNEDGSLVLEKNNDRRVYDVSEIKNIVVTTPGSRDSVRYITLETIRGKDRYYYGFLRNKDLNDNYQQIIDILHKFNYEKVEYTS